MKCYTGNKHTGELKTIAHIPIRTPLGEEEVIRWCPNCGAIVIDMQYDGRPHPGEAMPMLFPKYV